MATTVRRRERSASCSLRLAARPLPVITAPFLRRAVAGRVEEARGVRTAARPSVSSFERMTARRWRLLLIAVAALVVVLFVGACSSVYVKALWEAGDERCGKELAHYGGWEIGFSGDTDAFVCTVRDARLRIVAEKEIPVGKLIGRSGAWPYFSALVAHELEAIDKDSSPLGSRANFPEAMERAVRRYAVEHDISEGAARPKRIESVDCSQTRYAFGGEPVSNCRVSYPGSFVLLCAVSLRGRIVTEADTRQILCPIPFHQSRPPPPG
jgi:hypothetical protein